MPTKRKPVKRQTTQRNTTAASGVSQKRVLKHTKTDQSKKKTPTHRVEKKPIFPKPVWYFIGVVVVVLLAGLIYLGWNQWFRYDDKADFQGKWISKETGYEVLITDSQIVFNSETAYDYALDTFEKTITFTFKDLSGEGSYAFSEERDTLVIVEKGETSGTSVTTLMKASAVYGENLDKDDSSVESESNQNNSSGASLEEESSQNNSSGDSSPKE